MTLSDGYDDDDPADRRSARVLRTYRVALDQVASADDFQRATGELHAGLARARETRSTDQDD